jgi:hypothetical protein
MGMGHSDPPWSLVRLPTASYGAGSVQITTMAKIKRTCYADRVDEGRKRVLLIAASILAARKLAQFDSGARVPATVSAIADGVRWAERIMEEIDRRHPEKSPQQTSRS